MFLQKKDSYTGLEHHQGKWITECIFPLRKYIVYYYAEKVLCKCERCAWAGNKQTFFFQNSTKRNRNIYALMILLATTVVMHSIFNTHTHAEKQGHNQGHTSQINLQKNTATPNKWIKPCVSKEQTSIHNLRRMT